MLIGQLKPRLLIIGHRFVKRIFPDNVQKFSFFRWISGSKVKNVRLIIKHYIDSYLPDYVFFR